MGQVNFGELVGVGAVAALEACFSPEPIGIPAPGTTEKPFVQDDSRVFQASEAIHIHLPGRLASVLPFFSANSTGTSGLH